MLIKNFKKYVSFVASIFCVVSSPFTAFCYRGSKKVNDQKKPFKENLSLSQITPSDKTTVFSSRFDKCYEKYFAMAESSLKDSPFVLRIGENFSFGVLQDNLRLFMKYYSVITVESDTIEFEWFKKMINKIDSICDRTIWEKKILPLNGFGADKEKTFEKGYSLVIANVQNGKKIIFNFEIGNTISKNDTRVYYLFNEITKYNKILDYVLSLNPTSPSGLFPRKVTKYEIKNFTVAEGVKNISERCFTCIDNLVTVNFLDEIESLEKLAFNKCTMLKDVKFSKCVKNVGDKAFHSCHSLEKIEFPEGLESLGSSVFSDCFNLKYIVLPDSLERICSGTFSFAPKEVKIIYKKQEFSKKDFLNFFANNGGKVGISKV